MLVVHVEQPTKLWGQVRVVFFDIPMKVADSHNIATV